MEKHTIHTWGQQNPGKGGFSGGQSPCHVETTLHEMEEKASLGPRSKSTESRLIGIKKHNIRCPETWLSLNTSITEFPIKH